MRSAANAANVIRRIEAGHKVVLSKTAEGRDHAEIRRPWLLVRSVVALSAYEAALVEVALTMRQHRSNAGAVQARNLL